MNKEEARKLDIEVEMTVFGSQWFQVRFVKPSNPKRTAEWIRLLTPDEASLYPSGGWLIQAISDDEGMALFLAENLAPVRPTTLWAGPNYSTDIAAAWDVEEEIQRRGLVAEYGIHVTCMILEACHADDKGHTHYDFLHASPELRCRAALACVRAVNARTAARKGGARAEGANNPGRAQGGAQAP